MGLENHQRWVLLSSPWTSYHHNPWANVIIVTMLKVWTPIKVTEMIVSKHVISSYVGHLTFMVVALFLRCFN